jgi:tripartite-type tricarboxylate transporter receptor subunit TctC
MARVVAQHMAEKLGRPVVVDNQAGAGSLIAAQNVARAKPDGNTLLVAPVVVPAFFPAIYQKLSFDPIEDLVPIAELGDFSFALTVGPNVPVKDVPGFVAYLRANPGKVAYGSLSAGTPSHFLGTMFNQAAGTDMLHVPYKGAAPVFTALQSGEIQAAFVTSGSAVELHKAGRVKVLGVTGTGRSPLLPDVATISESVRGLQQMDQASLWYGFFAPKGTDAATAARLNEAIIATLKLPQVRDAIALQDVRIVYPSVAEFAQLVRRDNKSWGAVIRSTGFTLDQ